MPCTTSSRGLVRVLSMAYSAAVTKAVIPVAGRGTRFLPATKATPKVMLPVVDKPAVQYVVEEAVGAGLRDVLLITGDNQALISDHFGRAHELEAQLADDLIDSQDDLLARMIAARRRHGGSVVALMEVPADQVSAYGCVAFKPT